MRTIKSPEAFYGTQGQRERKVNRDGAATVVGGFYVEDWASAQPESTTIGLAMQGIARPVTATFHRSPLVAAEVAADNEYVECIRPDPLGSILDILVEGTTDIAAGDQLKPVNNQRYLVKATAGTDAYWAIALEAYTTNAVGTIKALVFGRPQPPQAIT